jgi:Holliday junction resolvase RusA-like endonuclease
MKIVLPLEVYYSKNKKFILNLNNYRNAHYRILSNSKKIYTDNLIPELKELSRFTEPVTLTYTYYAKTKRRIDISNPCSIIDKFTCDALVKAGVLKDDSFEQVNKVVYKFGGFDKENPRCELLISL